MVVYSGVIGVLFSTIALWGIRIDKDHKDFMSLQQTNCIKGILALEVFLCHVYAYYPRGLFMRAFNAAAYIPVALFFMFTGYGLVYNAELRPDYMKGFLRKRLLRLYIPLWASLVFSVVLRIVMSTERSYSIKTVFFDLAGLNAIWFFKVIVIYYFAFWLIWSFIPKKLRTYSLVALVVIQCVICFLLKTDKSYFTSSFGFVIGMFLGYGKTLSFRKLNDSCKWIRQHIFIVVTVALLLGGGLFSVYYLLHDEAFIGQLIMRNIIGIVLVGIFVLFNYVFRLGNRVSALLGKYSYELFLVHPAVLICVKSAFDMRLSQFAQIMIICGITAIGSFIVHWITDVCNRLVFLKG